MENYANEGNSVNIGAGLLSKEQIREIVEKINSTAIATVERGALEIGDIVLEDVFQGSLDEACSKDPFKSKALAMVCKEPDLMVNRRRLGEWVRASFLRKALIAKDVDCSNLSYSHFAALLQEEDADKRKELAASANQEQLSARKLIERIGKKAAKKTAQETALSSDITVGRLLEALANPLTLMEDKEVQQILGNPQNMRDRVPLSTAVQMADIIDKLIASMTGSVDLLILAKDNIALAYLAKTVDAQAIDV